MNNSCSPEAAVFCTAVQAGPTRAQSHMTCCQVPEKSNNVWNSLIRYAWLQLQPLGLQGKFLLIEAPWHQKKREEAEGRGCEGTGWDIYGDQV